MSADQRMNGSTVNGSTDQRAGIEFTSPMLFPGVRDADDFADMLTIKGAAAVKVEPPAAGDPFYKVHWLFAPDVCFAISDGPRRRLDVSTAAGEQSSVAALTCGIVLGFFCGLFWREIGRLLVG